MYSAIKTLAGHTFIKSATKSCSFSALDIIAFRGRISPRLRCNFSCRAEKSSLCNLFVHSKLNCDDTLSCDISSSNNGGRLRKLFTRCAPINSENICSTAKNRLNYAFSKKKGENEFPRKRLLGQPKVAA